jgi:tRNA(fMet)-specific endonuclease VapC
MCGRLAQIRKATKPESRVEAYKWLSKTVVFICGFTVLEFDEQAEALFQNLHAQKLKIETQDLKIAAIAGSKNAALVTRNRSDFGMIPGLKIEDWP